MTVAQMPFTIRVYDKNFNFKAFIGDPITLVVTPRFNETGTGTLVVEIDHHAMPALMEDGARIVIELRGDFLMSGKIHRREAQGPAVDGTMSIFFKDDFRLLHQILGYPVPTASLTGQTSEYATYTGKAETILKNAVRANMVTRLGLDVTVAPDLARGGNVPNGVALRFHPLYEKLFPAIEQAGLGVTFKQTGNTIVCDVFDPPVFPRTLTESSGVITTWSWASDDPTAIHVVAGGQGDGKARVFREVADTELYVAHNDMVEVFRDARDADTLAVLDARAYESLTEGEARSGFAVELSETEHFQYGQDGLVVGAQVTIGIGFVTRTDILREVTLSYTRDQGLVATPLVGNVSDSPDRTIANFLARLKKGVTDLKVSK